MDEETRPTVPLYRDRVTGQHLRPYSRGSNPHLWADYAPAHRGIPVDGYVLAAELIWEERQRQVDVEGYSIEHDEHHGSLVLYAAAKVYAGDTDARWPWAPRFLKPRGELRDLVRAGALLKAAEAVDLIENPWRVTVAENDFRQAVEDRETRRELLAEDRRDLLDQMGPVVGTRPGNPAWHELQDRIERKLAWILHEAAAVFGVPVERGQGA